MANITLETITNAFTTDGLFDVSGFENLFNEMKEYKKTLKDVAKKVASEEKKAKDAELDAAGEAYYKSLPEGATFQYRDSSKKVWNAKKILTKSNTGKRASCELIVSEEEIAAYEIKKLTRSPFFRQVIIPQSTEEVA